MSHARISDIRNSLSLSMSSGHYFPSLCFVEYHKNAFGIIIFVLSLKIFYLTICALSSSSILKLFTNSLRRYPIHVVCFTFTMNPCYRSRNWQNCFYIISLVGVSCLIFPIVSDGLTVTSIIPQINDLDVERMVIYPFIDKVKLFTFGPKAFKSDGKCLTCFEKMYK